jgi:AbrB family looped-hinge helix DNA binding protein
MSHLATVTSKSMVTIPAAIRRKYKLRQGAKVAFVEADDTIVLIPVPPLHELFGIDRAHRAVLLQAIRELHAEHRQEATQ